MGVLGAGARPASALQIVIAQNDHTVPAPDAATPGITRAVTQLLDDKGTNDLKNLEFVP